MLREMEEREKKRESEPRVGGRVCQGCRKNLEATFALMCKICTLVSCPRVQNQT